MARDTLLCPPVYYEQNRFKPARRQLGKHEPFGSASFCRTAGREPTELGTNLNSYGANPSKDY
jgi:hypothetical protein